MDQQLFTIQVNENSSCISGGPQRYLPKRILMLPHGLETSFMWAFVGTMEQCQAKLAKAIKKHPHQSKYTFLIVQLTEEQAQQVASETGYKARQARVAGLHLNLSEDGTSLCIAAASKKLNQAGQAFFDMFTGRVCGTLNDGRYYIKVRVK